MTVKTCDELVSASHISGSQEVIVTYERYLQIGGGDPFWTTAWTFRALYIHNAILAPRIGFDDDVVYDTVFTIQDGPQCLTAPIRRFLTNHGTYAAARQGGAPVNVRLA